MSLLPVPLLFLVILLFSACSPQTIKPTSPPLIQTKTDIPKDWTMRAKLGIRTPQKSGSVTLQWQQQDNQYHIRLSGPLGQGSGTLQGTPRDITIKRANKPTIYSNKPSELVLSSFGWDLPLEHLPYWVRGLASPNAAIEQQQYNPSETLALLQQSGWLITYSRYRPIAQWLMPHRIVIKKEDIRLTLIVKTWNFPNHE